MSQVEVECLSCGNKFTAEKADIYECPKCGTNVRPKQKKKDFFDDESTQQFHI